MSKYQFPTYGGSSSGGSGIGGVLKKTGSYTALSGDNGKLLAFSVGSFASSLIQSNSATTGGSQTNTVAATFPSNNVSGNLLICAVRNFVLSGSGTVTVTDSKGQTWVELLNYQSGPNDFTSFWYFPTCGAGANTVTVTCATSSTFPRMCIAEYQTPNQTPDNSNHATGSSTTWNSGNITPSNVENLFGFLQNNTGSSTYTPDSGWTFREEPDSGAVLYDQLDAAPGTYHFSGTLGTSSTWDALIVSFSLTPGLAGDVLTLPPTAPSLTWMIFVQNYGSNPVTIDPNGLNLDTVAANLTLPAGKGIIIFTDGTDYFTCRGGS